MEADPRIDRVLQGRYRLSSVLARGGMGVVYQGERTGIGRAVVVKFLHANLQDKPAMVDRFEREARATARLNHPNCVAIVDFGLDEGAPYLVMEFVEGVTAADLLDHGVIAPKRAVHIIKQVLAALAHAHARGVLHRDLKPANVILVDDVGVKDFVKLLDFGLAKITWSEAEGNGRDVTVKGMAIGTPGYMSPEQAAGGVADERSDIYCVGALLYHMVTGRRPFEGDDVHALLKRHREETPPLPRAANPHSSISNELERVIAKAMERKGQNRYDSAESMIAALDQTPEAKVPMFAPSVASSTGPPPLPVAGRRPQIPGSVAMVVGLLVGMFATVAFFMLR